jgi:CRISPR-associated protein Cas1
VNPTDLQLLPAEALHALTYCERLFYLEYVEGLHVVDANVYAGRTLHVELAQGDETVHLKLADESFGLVGAVDAIRRRDGNLVPYEQKRGRAKKADDGHYEAWPSDAVQVGAYALLVEAATGRQVSEGMIRYHADGVTVKVAVDDELRARIRRTLDRARELAEQLDRPPVTTNERLCVHCSLAPVCLPEEERLIVGLRDVVRLFPPAHEGTVVHVTRPGSTVRRAGERVVVHTPEDTREFPVQQLHSLVLHGPVHVTPGAVALCTSMGVALHWFTRGGRFLGTLNPTIGAPQRKVRQYRALTDPEVRLRLARRLVAAKLANTRRYLLRASRNGSREDLRDVIKQIARLERKVPSADSAETLRGIEGAAGRLYFAVLPQMIASGVPDALKPDGRSRRPPQDRYNALLSFCYALLERCCLEAIIVVGLEPALGFYHTPRSAAPPLVLDLMELFRLPLCDVPVLGAVKRRTFDPDHDFQVAQGHVWLSASGRAKAVEVFERRLGEMWRHPATGYSLSWKRLVELEVRLLEKEWSGVPGLFAQFRLR